MIYNANSLTWSSSHYLLQVVLTPKTQLKVLLTLILCLNYDRKSTRLNYKHVV